MSRGMDILFQPSLKSQDDFSIKYKTFEDDDYSRDVQRIEKVFNSYTFRCSQNIIYTFFVLHLFNKNSFMKCIYFFFVFQIRTLGYSGQHPIFPVDRNRAVLVISNRLTLFDWMSKEQYNFQGQHVSISILMLHSLIMCKFI